MDKHQTRLTGLDTHILPPQGRGPQTREIQGHLEEVYGVQVSPALISEVTDAVLEEVTAWRNRRLEPICQTRVSGRADGEDAAQRAGGQPGGVGGHRQ